MGAAAEESFAAENPFDCFQRDDVWDTLAKHPDTRAYIADTGFREAIEKLRTVTDTQQAAQASMKDPRVMQAMAALQGWGLSVTEDEIKYAESVGDMKKRDPVQMKHLEVCLLYTSPSPRDRQKSRMPSSA